MFECYLVVILDEIKFRSIPLLLSFVYDHTLSHTTPVISNVYIHLCSTFLNGRTTCYDVSKRDAAAAAAAGLGEI